MNLLNVFKNLSNGAEKVPTSLSKEEIAELLKTTPEAIDEFEKAYYQASELEEKKSDNLFDINSRDAVNQLLQNSDMNFDNNVDIIVNRIVDELLEQSNPNLIGESNNISQVAQEEINKLPQEIRPLLTGHLMKVDIDEPSFATILYHYNAYKKAINPKVAKTYYNMFRQGLDILDLDPITYSIIGMNKNSIGYWYPTLKDASEKQSFFKVPKTKIVKVPLPLLQLTRQDYMGLNQTTLDIVNKWAYKAFRLDENKTYFVKTGTYSSKFDFRNAKVTTPKEVRELGSYLLFIHFQALQMASPLSVPQIYGASTTNEWCVREYIEDKENNPCIYHGMPLHTEYRVFIDCDTKEVLGIAPYWEPDIMKKRFSKGKDSESADMKHDYIIYLSHEDKLMDRYEKNKDIVVEKVKEMLPNIHLDGQWSLDVMQNGDDFWLIDMATADTSALNNCIPNGKLKKSIEDWIPKLQVK